MAAQQTKPASTKQEASSATWPGAFAAYGKAFQQIMKNPGPALLFMGTYAVLSLLSMSMQNGRSYMDTNYATFEDIAYFIFLLALPTYGLAVADGKSISIGEFMRFNARKYFSILAASILYLLIVIGSLALLIVPAVWTIAWFFASMYAVADKNLGPIQALKESKRLAQNHKAKVWGLIGVSILVFIPAAMLLYIPVFGTAAYAFVTILSTAAGAVLYRWLLHQKPAA